MTTTINVYAAAGCWLYKLGTDNDEVMRDFKSSITCRPDEVSNWAECTQQEREEYEKAWAEAHSVEEVEELPQEEQL
jgi:hypothetical protein